MLRTNTSGSAVGQHTLLRVCTPLSPQQHHFWVSPLGAHIEDQMSRGFAAAPQRNGAGPPASLAECAAGSGHTARARGKASCTSGFPNVGTGMAAG